jgi:excisionase family DNA binding protein
MRIEIDDLFTIRIAARLVGVSRQTVYHWLRLGKLDRVMIGEHLFVRGSQLQRMRPGCVRKRRSR